MLDMFKNVAVAMTLYNPLEEDIQNLINYAAVFMFMQIHQLKSFGKN